MEKIEDLPTPVALAEEMKFMFTDDQANFIAAEIYQPLMNLIQQQCDFIERHTDPAWREGL